MPSHLYLSSPSSIALALMLALALGAAGAGCATTRYAEPAAAQLNDDALPAVSLLIFRDRPVTVRVVDARVDRPQTVVLMDHFRDVLERAVRASRGGTGRETPATFDVRVMRYQADAELSRWRACVTFAASVDIGPDVRHELTTERCAVTKNVWGTESADVALREAVREAVRDLLGQVDGLTPPAAATPPQPPPSPVTPTPPVPPSGPAFPAAG